MKTLLPFITLLFCTTLITAQTYERTDDHGFNSRVERIHSVGDTSWVGLFRYNEFASYGIPMSLIQYFNSNGILQWEFENPDPGPSLIKELLVTGDNNIAFVSSVSACDVAWAPTISVNVLDLNGNLLFSNELEVEVDPFAAAFKGSVSQDVMYLTTEYMDFQSPFSTQVIGFDNNGNYLWTALLEYNDVHAIATLQNDAVVFGENQLMRIDGDGVKVDSLAYAQPPADVAPAENQIFMAMTDGVYLLDANLMLTPVILDYPETGPPFQILSEAGETHLVYGDVIHVYDSSYELVESINLNALPNFQIEDCNVHEDAYALVGNRPFTTTIRYMGGTENFETSSGAMQLVPLTDEVPDQFPDAALRHLEITNYNASSHQADALFYLVNEGNLPLDSVQVNFMANVNPTTCGTMGATERFQNLALAPGDSAQLAMEGLAYGYPFNDLPEDSAGVEFCVYVTQPNNLYDRVAANDQACANVVGVGIRELLDLDFSIFPNPAKDMLRWECNNCDFREGSLQFISPTGRIIKELPLAGYTSKTLDVSHWPSGLYLARLIADGKVSKPVKFAVHH